MDDESASSGRWRRRTVPRGRSMYQRHVGNVFGLVYHLVGGDRHVAEDVNQEVWLLAIERFDRFDPAQGRVPGLAAGHRPPPRPEAPPPGRGPGQSKAGPRSRPTPYPRRSWWKGWSGPTWCAALLCLHRREPTGRSWTSTPRGSRSRRSRPGAGGRPRGSSRCCRGPVGSSVPSCGLTFRTPRRPTP